MLSESDKAQKKYPMKPSHEQKHLSFQKSRKGQGVKVFNFLSFLRQRAGHLLSRQTGPKTRVTQDTNVVLTKRQIT